MLFFFFPHNGLNNASSSFSKKCVSSRFLSFKEPMFHWSSLYVTVSHWQQMDGIINMRLLVTASTGEKLSHGFRLWKQTKFHPCCFRGFQLFTPRKRPFVWQENWRQRRQLNLAENLVGNHHALYMCNFRTEKGHVVSRKEVKLIPSSSFSSGLKCVHNICIK